MSTTHANRIEPPEELNHKQQSGWRAFFNGRGPTSMRGYDETQGWWFARSRAYALGWHAATIHGEFQPVAFRDHSHVSAAWIDGFQHHKAITGRDAEILRALL